MKVGLMQPTFLPWQGYFALAANVDTFVFLDDFQFCRHTFQHRNRLFLAREQADWVTVPVEHPGSETLAPLDKVRPLLDERKFRKKLLQTLQQNYGRCEGFGEIFPLVEEWLGRDWPSVAELNIAFIERVAGLLGLATRFLRSSTVNAPGKRSQRVLALLRTLGARTYLASEGAHGYMREDAVFPVDDIEVRFQQFRPAPYPQRHAATFVPYLSVLDALLQVGPQATRRLLDEGQKQFVPWSEMGEPAAAVFGDEP